MSLEESDRDALTSPTHPTTSVAKNLPEAPPLHRPPLTSSTNTVPPPPAPEIASQLDDLLHIQLAFIQGMISFTSVGRRLRFIKPPSCDKAFVRWDVGLGESCNSGECALHPQHLQNRPFLDYQESLSVTHKYLKWMGNNLDEEVNEYRDGLMSKIVEELERLEDTKEWEWERQARQDLPFSGPGDSSEHSRFTVDTDRHVAAQWTSWTPTNTPVYSYSIVSAYSNLLLGLSRRATGTLMAGLRSTIHVTLQYARAPGPLLSQDHQLLRQLNRDPRTILNALDLDPHVVPYNCCSRCFALYDLSGVVPTTCTNRSAPESPPCGTKLSRRRKIGGNEVAFPVRKYLHQSMKHWLGRMLCRKDIETWLRVSRWDNNRAKTTMKDIFDAIALQSFRGPDPHSYFLDAPSDELRLIFALSADGFNPYQMKEAKQSVTSTAIYMICLNLPEHLRYLPENIYLVGVIPGPTKPSTSQINHSLALIVDELLDFWNPGVYYTKTALSPEGRLVRAALVPLVADLLAARQLSGMGPHNHSRFLCSLCTTSADNVEDIDPSTFQPRNLEQHRADANAWLKARTTLEREQLYTQTGVRYSELLRLPYWNPLLYTVVDTMHNLYLGVLQRHIRAIWGISVDVGDGDASDINSAKAPPRPPEDKMSIGTNLLLYADEKELRKAGKAVLYHLCVDRGIRRAGTIPQLVKNLVAWRKKEGITVERRDVRTETSQDAAFKVDYGGTEPSKEIKSAEKTLRGDKASTALENKKKDVLIAMCRARSMEIDYANVTRPVLAKHLISWLEEQRLTESLQNMTLGETESSDESEEPHTFPTSLIADSTSGPSRRSGPTAQTEDSHDADGRAVHDNDSHNPAQQDTAPPAGSRNTQAAIGRDTLDAYVEDRSRMELPSWVNAPPAAFGTTQHGKLSADQWRTLCIINLPVSLIRTWSFQEERRVKMLQNFLKLVEAVETFGLLEIDERQIATAERLMQEYLEGVKELYQGAKIQPNHHLSLHIGVFLRLFGPVHSWRSFVFERFNFYLQSLNTNMTFGELELTFMMHSCRAANFQPLLRSPPVQRYMQDFSNALTAAGKHDRRGMRLDAILRSSTGTSTPDESLPQGEPYKGSRPAHLEAAVYKALLERFSFEDGAQYMDERQYFSEHPAGKLPLPRTAVRCTSVFLDGVSYKPWNRSPGDSNVMFRHPALGNELRPGRIETVALHTRRNTHGQDISETFLVIRPLKPLNDSDAELDPYRKYPGVGGRLYYDAYEDQIRVLRGEDVASHFALTRMDHLVVKVASEADTTKTAERRISKPCIHVRPLDRLLRSARVPGEELESLGSMDSETTGAG
ncbi:hypothetical protein VTO73DRAFT_3877 [Trametes versicolor]